MSFPERVSAVSPLGEAIDGTSQPKPRRTRRPPRERMNASATFFCSNPQCDHATWSEREQAVHMAREFWEVAQALVRLAPESQAALKLSGGVILRDLTDNECRAASLAYQRNGSRIEGLPIETQLRRIEYHRRVVAGTLTDAPEPRPPLVACKRAGHPFTDENTYVTPAGYRVCRMCRNAGHNARFRERYRTDAEFREKVLEASRQAKRRRKQRDEQVAP